MAFGDQLAIGRDTLLWRGEHIPWYAVSHFASDDDDGDGDAADFPASVERDIDQLPTLDESDRR